MPAPKMFLKSSDISKVTGMSVRAAQNMLYMFAQQGKTIRCGKSARGQMVDVNIFVQYLCSQDGTDPKERKHDVLECMRELGASK